MPILDISVMWPSGQSYSVTLTSVLSPPRYFIACLIQSILRNREAGVGLDDQMAPQMRFVKARAVMAREMGLRLQCSTREE